MFSTGRTGTFGVATVAAELLPSLKRSRRGSPEDEQGRQSYASDDKGVSCIKRRRGGGPNHTEDTFQLSFLTPPADIYHFHSDPFASYQRHQPTPPIDSDNESTSDRFAATFAMDVQDNDRDEDMMDDSIATSQASDLPWKRAPRVVIGPPTPVSEMGPGMGRLDANGDVDMDHRQPVAGLAGGDVGDRKKAGGSFRMGFRADCEKCRLKVPGHYNHH